MVKGLKAKDRKAKAGGSAKDKKERPTRRPNDRSASRESVTVDAGVMLLTSQVDPDGILEALRKLFEDLAEEDRPAEVPQVGPDYMLAGGRVVIIEAKRANVTLPDREFVSRQAISEDVERYAGLAAEIFHKSLREDMTEAVLLMLVKAVITAIAARNKEGFLKPIHGSEDLFKKVFASLAALLKDRVGVKRSGRPRELTPAKELAYVPTYYKALADLNAIKDLIKKMAEGGKGVSFDRVVAEIPYDEVTTEMVKGLMSSASPSDFAHKLAAIRLKVTYGPYLEDIITRHNHKK